MLEKNLNDIDEQIDEAHEKIAEQVREIVDLEKEEQSESRVLSPDEILHKLGFENKADVTWRDIERVLSTYDDGNPDDKKFKETIEDLILDSVPVDKSKDTNAQEGDALFQKAVEHFFGLKNQSKEPEVDGAVDTTQEPDDEEIAEPEAVKRAPKAEKKTQEDLELRYQSLVSRLSSLDFEIAAILDFDIPRANKAGDEDRIFELKGQVKKLREKKKRLEEKIRSLSFRIEAEKEGKDVLPDAQDEVDEANGAEDRKAAPDELKVPKGRKKKTELKVEPATTSETLDASKRQRKTKIGKTGVDEQKLPELTKAVNGVESEVADPKAVLRDLNGKVAEVVRNKGADLLKNKDVQGILEDAEIPYQFLVEPGEQVGDLEREAKAKSKDYFVNRQDRVFEGKTAKDDLIKQVRGAYAMDINAAKDRLRGKLKKDLTAQDQQDLKDIKLRNYIEKAWNNLSVKQKEGYAKKLGLPVDDEMVKLNFVAFLARERFDNIKLNCKKDIVSAKVESLDGKPKPDAQMELFELEQQDERFKDFYIAESGAAEIADIESEIKKAVKDLALAYDKEEDEKLKSEKDKEPGSYKELDKDKKPKKKKPKGFFERTKDEVKDLGKTFSPNQISKDVKSGVKGAEDSVSEAGEEVGGMVRSVWKWAKGLFKKNKSEDNSEDDAETETEEMESTESSNKDTDSAEREGSGFKLGQKLTLKEEFSNDDSFEGRVNITVIGLLGNQRIMLRALDGQTFGAHPSFIKKHYDLAPEIEADDVLPPMPKRSRKEDPPVDLDDIVSTKEDEPVKLKEESPETLPDSGDSERFESGKEREEGAFTFDSICELVGMPKNSSPRQVAAELCEQWEDTPISNERHQQIDRIFGQLKIIAATIDNVEKALKKLKGEKEKAPDVKGESAKKTPEKYGDEIGKANNLKELYDMVSKGDYEDPGYLKEVLDSARRSLEKILSKKDLKGLKDFAEPGFDLYLFDQDFIKDKFIELINSIRADIRAKMELTGDKGFDWDYLKKLIEGNFPNIN